MAKKILAICVALVALAVVPAMASASPELTEGTTATTTPTGTGIKATNNGNILFTTGFGTITCTSSTMTGTVHQNSGTSILGTISAASFSGAATGGRCASTISDLQGGTLTFGVTPENLHWCIESTTLGSFSITGGACTESPRKNLKFTLDVFTGSGTASGTCTYERASVTGTYNTKTTPLELTIGASQTFTRVSGTTLCPSSGTLSGKYKLTTSTGGALSIS